MKNMLYRMWTEDEGVLSFEWVLLVTLVTIGVVSGIAAARDAIISSCGKRIFTLILDFGVTLFQCRKSIPRGFVKCEVTGFFHEVRFSP